jgi:hypothetical protein
MSTAISLNNYQVKSVFQTALLSAILQSSWSQFYAAARDNNQVASINSSAIFPVDYLFAGKEGAENAHLRVDVRLSGDHFPYEGGFHLQPGTDLAEKAFGEFSSEAKVIAEGAPISFELTELLAVGKGRYNVTVKVTVTLEKAEPTSSGILPGDMK